MQDLNKILLVHVILYEFGIEAISKVTNFFFSSLEAIDDNEKLETIFEQ